MMISLEISLYAAANSLFASGDLIFKILLLNIYLTFTSSE